MSDVFDSDSTCCSVLEEIDEINEKQNWAILKNISNIIELHFAGQRLLGIYEISKHMKTISNMKLNSFKLRYQVERIKSQLYSIYKEIKSFESSDGIATPEPHTQINYCEILEDLKMFDKDKNNCISIPLTTDSQNLSFNSNMLSNNLYISNKSLSSDDKILSNENVITTNPSYLNGRDFCEITNKSNLSIASSVHLNEPMSQMNSENSKLVQNKECSKTLERFAIDNYSKIKIHSNLILKENCVDMNGEMNCLLMPNDCNNFYKNPLDYNQQASNISEDLFTSHDDSGLNLREEESETSSNELNLFNPNPNIDSLKSNHTNMKDPSKSIQNFNKNSKNTGKYPTENINETNSLIISNTYSAEVDYYRSKNFIHKSKFKKRGMFFKNAEFNKRKLPRRNEVPLSTVMDSKQNFKYPIYTPNPITENCEDLCQLADKFLKITNDADDEHWKNVDVLKNKTDAVVKKDGEAVSELGPENWTNVSEKLVEMTAMHQEISESVHGLLDNIRNEEQEKYMQAFDKNLVNQLVNCLDPLDAQEFDFKYMVQFNIQRLKEISSEFKRTLFLKKSRYSPENNIISEEDLCDFDWRLI